MSQTIITEKRTSNEVVYKRTIVFSDGQRLSSVIRPKAAIVKYKDEEYYILYDSKMKVIKSVFRYMNYGLSNSIARNTKLRHLEALKFLTAFEEITDKKLENFKLDDINTLKYFLAGNFSNLKGQEYTLHLTTKRSIATINGCLSIYRNYLKYLEVKEHILFHESTFVNWRNYNNTSESVNHRESFLTSERLPKKIIEVPEYISVEQYKNIIDIINKKYTLRELCIVRLMFEYNLRIGECLGITNDDLIEMKDAEGKYQNVLLLRNRVSDKKDQIAKGCMTVTSRNQYSSNEYNTEAVSGGGYQKIVIEKELTDLIIDYIEGAHAEATSNKAKRLNYEKYTKADRVTPAQNPYEEDNFYIFLNSKGTPLRQDTWNKTLKQIFIDCDIPVDKGKKQHNLNHRLRHGFAMFHVQYLGTDVVTLAREMRHSSLTSTYNYTKPTISDQIKLKNEFSDELRKQFPALAKFIPDSAGDKDD